MIYFPDNKHIDNFKGKKANVQILLLRVLNCIASSGILLFANKSPDHKKSRIADS